MNMLLHFTLTTALVILLTGATALCQTTTWRNYTFTGNITTLADAGPYLWIGTTNGLLRFTKATGEREI